MPAVDNREMSPFSRAAGPPVINALRENDSRADPGADGCVEYVLVSPAGPPDRLRQCGGIGVVVYPGFYPERSLHFVAQGEVSPARQIGRIDHHPAAWIERAGRADSNSRQAILGTRIGLQHFIDCAPHRRESFSRAAVCHHRHPRLEEDRSLRAYQAGGDLASSNVDPQQIRFRHDPSPSPVQIQRLAAERTKMAPTSTATPALMMRSGCFPAFFHSPVIAPPTVAVLTTQAMTNGHTL